MSTVCEDGKVGKTYPLHPIDFKFDVKDFRVTRRQFSVRLVLTTTVQNEKVKTLRRVVVDEGSLFFGPGRLYVALLRTRKN